uniref:MO25-like protein n=1 Tax=Lactuca sativa TaxID=4236 RepID=A0A9R1UWL7_LACSA|nr:hypothetical protein LSAT_V11C700388010 [Lactuca sativa]
MFGIPLENSFSYIIFSSPCSTRYILEPIQLKKLFGYIQLPSFDISADVADVFKDLLTRHKSTVSESLSKNYSWFFTEYNEKLLKSSNYITKRQAIKLLGSILLDRSNSAFMRRYVSSKDNLIILMNLLRDTSRSIQIDAFHVFKLFVANEEKPIEIVSILITNRNKLLRLLGAFVYTGMKGGSQSIKLVSKRKLLSLLYLIDLFVMGVIDDQVFETDKDQVVNELTLLEI